MLTRLDYTQPAATPDETAQISEKSRAQARPATGRAITSPIAKPRRAGRFATAASSRALIDAQLVESVVSVMATCPRPGTDRTRTASCAANILLQSSTIPYLIESECESSSRANVSSVRRFARFAVVSAVFPAALFVSQPATAQERPVGSPEGVLEKSEPKGLRAGTWTLYPSVGAELRYDSNVYNQPSGARDDTVAVIRPRLRVASGWSRHSLSLDASGEVRRYFQLSDENSEQYALRADGKFELAERVTMAAAVVAARRIERRGTVGDLFRSDKPVEYDERSASVALARTGGLLELRATGSLSRVTYNDAIVDGLPVDLSSRDVRRVNAGIRADYEMSDRTRLFAAVSGNDIHYLHSVTTTSRDSKGFSVVGGIKYDVSGLLSLEAGAGLIRQDFDDSGKKDFTGVGFNASATWTPQLRWRLEMEAARSVERSPRQDADAVVETTVTATVSYALGARTLVSVEGGYIGEDFRGIDRSENRYFAELRARYALTPEIGVYAGVGYRKQEGQGIASRDYHGMTARIGVGIAL